MSSHHGSAVAAGQGQVFGGGTRYGYRGRGKHQGIEAGDVTRIEDAIVVLVEGSEEVVVVAGGNLERVACRTGWRSGRGAHLGEIDLHGVLVEEAHIKRSRGLLAEGDLAGDSIGGGRRADGDWTHHIGPIAGGGSRDPLGAEVIGVALREAGDSGRIQNPVAGIPAGGREAGAASNRAEVRGRAPLNGVRGRRFRRTIAKRIL